MCRLEALSFGQSLKSKSLTEFVGWFYGNLMMPGETPLIALSPTRFYVDAFRYDEGAAWGEKAVFLEFQMKGGRVSGVILEQDDKLFGKKISR